MPTTDALRLTFPKGKSREVQVHLKSLKRDVILRRGTSDIWCLQNVFLDEEYNTPFPAEPKVIIDAGANIGMATLFFSHKYPAAKIIAIEPETSNFALLTRNCAGLWNVTLSKAALWPTERVLAIRDCGAEKWAFSVTEKALPNGVEPIATVTIPGVLRQLGVEHVDILKLDIEGAERELFGPEAEAWLGSVGQIIIELHDRLFPGCAAAFYSQISRYPFVQDIAGKNIFVSFRTATQSLENSSQFLPAPILSRS